MAALSDRHPESLVELHDLNRAQIADLLDEETEHWRTELDWDFAASADLVRRFVDLSALSGCALRDAGEVIGYCYFVLEDQKGLVGDLYVRRDFRTPDHEHRLFAAVLDDMMNTSHVRRIESQLMMIPSSAGLAPPASRFLNSYLRNFMLVDLEQADLPQGRIRHRVFLEKWAENYQEAAAQLISAAYLGHVDSNINDQYRSTAGARRFLFNIVQYPGCGAFYRQASFAAFDPEGRMCGMCLTSLVAPEVGHITQICVGNWVRGSGVGYELLRQSLLALREAGCRRVSLTVTSSNRDAVLLYERTGFVTRRRFFAYVWEGF